MKATSKIPKLIILLLIFLIIVSTFLVFTLATTERFPDSFGAALAGSFFSLPPLYMLAGAASMLPGGVGSTEAAIVVQLK